MSKRTEQFLYIIWFFCITGIILLVVAPLKADTQLHARREALNIIADFADRICNDVPLAGTRESIKLSGEAKAELSNVIAKLAKLGIKGVTKYANTKYQGVLQEDLATAIETGMKCKNDIATKLESELLPTSGNMPSQRIDLECNQQLYGSTKNAMNCGDGNTVNIQQDAFR
ncbi:MAG: hypothetical protein P8173_15840 [Gammaproteobacteria bacterium]|jgi:hypothetical protein